MSKRYASSTELRKLKDEHIRDNGIIINPNIRLSQKSLYMPMQSQWQGTGYVAPRSEMERNIEKTELFFDSRTNELTIRDINRSEKFKP